MSNIPSEIKELIYIINRQSNDSPRNFWFFDNLNPTGGLANSGFRIYDYSWFTTSTFSLVNYTNSYLGLCNGIQSVYINSDGNGGYNCTFSWSCYTYEYYVGGTLNRVNFGNIVDNGNIIMYDQFSNIVFNKSGTLYEVFDALKNKVKNVYIFVDGENWTDPDAQTYNWQSVPSISGKNGILSLVTLDSEAINDGEPVSGAAVSVFDQTPSTDNNVKDLADTYGSGEESSAVDVTVKYKVTLPPGGSFSVLKLVAKKDSIPEDATDGDKIVDISPTKTKKTVTGLDENSTYYFKIFAEDSNSNTSESDEKHILTSGDEGYNFDYTGEIVEWTVPKTGIYSLETWGAQGGEATDGTNSARGGYGAYVYGEVLLTQGEKLYINVGGQNGYGGGGVWYDYYTLADACKTNNWANHRKTSTNHNYTADINTDVASQYSSFLGTDWILDYVGDNPSGMWGNTPVEYDASEGKIISTTYNKHIAFPIKTNIGQIVKITYDVHITGGSGTYKWLKPCVDKVSGSSLVNVATGQHSSDGSYEINLTASSDTLYFRITNAECTYEISNIKFYNSEQV